METSLFTKCLFEFMPDFEGSKINACVDNIYRIWKENCVIGNNVVLQSGCVIGGDGFGYITDKKTGRQKESE